MPDCNDCGACRKICPAYRYGPPSGGPQENPWVCANCWLCQEACPREVAVRQRLIAAQRHRAPPAGIAAGLANIAATGLAMPVGDDINARRADYGLETLPLAPARLLKLLGGQGTA
jgi:heterodisulfide reductase subunit C